MELLRTIVRMLGFTNREIERRANLNHATSVKYFRGEGEPKLDFVLAVVRAIGLEYWEFFELAYPERGQPSVSGQRLRRLLNQFPRAEPAAPARHLEEMIEELRREVRALTEKS
ncbi:MAG TPA: hypothetical protein VN493_19210 [Thermoanaerobaculia bacterium]|nr:hypothetical protein [Thermoanaerobaculia bacterium]